MTKNRRNVQQDSRPVSDDESEESDSNGNGNGNGNGIKDKSADSTLHAPTPVRP